MDPTLNGMDLWDVVESRRAQSSYRREVEEIRAACEIAIKRTYLGVSKRIGKERLYAAYPFKERSGREYKMWLEACRVYLMTMFGELPAPDRYPALTLAIFPFPTPWLAVSCEFCNAKPIGNSGKYLKGIRGCILCGDKLERLDEILAWPDFMAMLNDYRNDNFKHHLLGVMSDWLMDHNYIEAAELFRMEFER